MIKRPKSDKSGHITPIIHRTLQNGLEAIFWYRWIALDFYFQNLPGPQLPYLSIFLFELPDSLFLKKFIKMQKKNRNIFFKQFGLLKLFQPLVLQ